MECRRLTGNQAGAQRMGRILSGSLTFDDQGVRMGSMTVKRVRENGD